MINEFVNAWDENKNKLEEYFKITNQAVYGDYKNLLCILIDKVINPYIHKCPHFTWEKKLDVDNITEIDNGDYQGTLLFIVPLKTYQPGVTDYFCFYVYYGCCSGCDTLEAIREFNDIDIPTDEQVKDYMTLCLHMLQGAFRFGEK